MALASAVSARRNRQVSQQRTHLVVKKTVDAAAVQVDIKTQQHKLKIMKQEDMVTNDGRTVAL
ncbi:MAG: hypothetical protein EPN21_06325 [Methylococcaceae bacterium]|nr:MAG: hypothetical protein EPN21_06325 [Methylococcaceae bacterium]